jgi:hypothetical protein
MADWVMTTTDEEIEAALEEARNAPEEVTIFEARYRPEPGLEFLMLRLSDGRRLLIPKEELGELKNATPEQAADLTIGPHGVDVWWPQLDDGLYLPDFLEYRWGKVQGGVAAKDAPSYVQA